MNIDTEVRIIWKEVKKKKILFIISNKKNNDK